MITYTIRLVILWDTVLIFNKLIIRLITIRFIIRFIIKCIFRFINLSDEFESKPSLIRFSILFFYITFIFFQKCLRIILFIYFNGRIIINALSTTNICMMHFHLVLFYLENVYLFDLHMILFFFYVFIIITINKFTIKFFIY